MWTWGNYHACCQCILSSYSWKAADKLVSGKTYEGAYHDNQGAFTGAYPKQKSSCNTMAYSDRQRNGPTAHGYVSGIYNTRGLERWEDWRLAEPRSLPQHKCLQTTLWNSLTGLGRHSTHNSQFWMGARLRNDASSDGSYQWTWESDGATVNDGWTNWAKNEPPSNALEVGKIYMCLNRGTVDPWDLNLKKDFDQQSKWYACKSDNPDVTFWRSGGGQHGISWKPNTGMGSRYSACCNFGWAPGGKREELYKSSWHKKTIAKCTTTTTTMRPR